MTRFRLAAQVGLLLCLTGCASAGASTATQPSPEPSTASPGRHGAAGFTGLCLSVRITKKNSRSNGGTGPRPKRSCVAADEDAVLRLIAQLHQAVHGRGTICALLTDEYRQNAERWAHQSRSTCDRALVSNTGSPPYTRQQLSHPAARIIFFYSYRGTGAIVTLWRPSQGASRASSPHNPINVAIARDAGGTWQISQIGYEF